jgi:hypothetical protein
MTTPLVKNLCVFLCLLPRGSALQPPVQTQSVLTHWRFLSPSSFPAILKMLLQCSEPGWSGRVGNPWDWQCCRIVVLEDSASQPQFLPWAFDLICNVLPCTNVLVKAISGEHWKWGCTFLLLPHFNAAKPLVLWFPHPPKEFSLLSSTRHFYTLSLKCVGVYTCHFWLEHLYTLLAHILACSLTMAWTNVYLPSEAILLCTDSPHTLCSCLTPGTLRSWDWEGAVATFEWWPLALETIGTMTEGEIGLHGTVSLCPRRRSVKGSPVHVGLWANQGSDSPARWSDMKVSLFKRHGGPKIPDHLPDGGGRMVA